MTRPNGNNEELTVKEADRMADAIEPRLQAGFQRQLDEQTLAIHNYIDAHEGNDNAQFASINKRINYAAGALAVAGAILSLLAPVGVGLIKRWLKLP